MPLERRVVEPGHIRVERAIEIRIERRRVFRVDVEAVQVGNDRIELLRGDVDGQAPFQCAMLQVVLERIAARQADVFVVLQVVNGIEQNRHGGVLARCFVISIR